MSAIGRLWRRAPAWRMWLFVGVASTAMAAMFPPHLPGLSSYLSRHRPAPRPRYTPQPDAPPNDVATVSLPPLTGTRQTLLAFAGRQVALPAGKWSEMALLRAAGQPPNQAMVLARLQSNHMTGMIVIVGTSVTDQEVPMPIGPCIDPTGRPIHDLTPPGNHDPLVQECVSLRGIATTTLTDTHAQPLESRALERLGSLNIAVPDRLLVSRYFRHDDHGMLLVSTMLPDPTRSDGLKHRVEAWSRRWVPLLHAGFDSGLSPAAVTPELARDPGFVADKS